MPPRPLPARLATLVALALVAACGGGGTTVDTPVGLVGELLSKPGGEPYFQDDHRRGLRTRLHLVEVTWGRKVDVFAVDATGNPSPSPFLRDLVIDETFLTDGLNYELTIQPVTQREQLIVRRRLDGTAEEAAEFEALLRAAMGPLPGVRPLAPDATIGGPFSLVPRNATLVLRFDDLLADDAETLRRLPELVRLATGSPTVVPQPALMSFDPNHGGLAGSTFHSTRVLIDFAISAFEASQAPISLPIVPRGLPASRTDVVGASAVVRLPTKTDPGNGQFLRLTNLGGSPMDLEGNGPVDMGAATRDVLRAFRAGNREDVNNGYLLDARRPSLLSDWQLEIEAARDDPTGALNEAFLLDLRFTTSCRGAPGRGDVLSVGAELLGVVENASEPDVGGRVADVRVRLLAGTTQAAALPGGALFVTRHDPSAGLNPACWMSFLPPGTAPPAGNLPADTTLRVRFDEPLDPESFQAFDTMRLVRGDSAALPNPLARDLVVGEVVDAPDLQSFVFRPQLPLANGNGGTYFLELLSGTEGVSDLSGNPLASTLPRVDFRLDPGEPDLPSQGIVLRFESLDELPPSGVQSLRGQVTIDDDRGVARPRPTIFTSYPVDRGNAVPNLMQPFPPGVQTPLSPLGSRLMAVWRYVDLGWRIRDETKYNLDVVGMSWSPVGGFPLNDFFPEFEMRVAHSQKIPDEAGSNANGALYRNSGLFPETFPFTTNVVGQSESGLQVVHGRALGYRITASDLSVNSHGTPVVPFPWNRSSGPFTSFTWRDTSLLVRAGTAGVGVPLTVEVEPPLAIEEEIGSFALAGAVPSVGLPFLWEIRTWPTGAGVGLNPLDVALASPPGWQYPRSRAYSTGGIDESGNVITKAPDLELFPTGGFNPSSSPPGKPTTFAADPIFYMGELDTVTRISRAFTSWIDTGLPAPRYTEPILEPAEDEQPLGTAVRIEFRSATGFNVADPLTPFDTAQLDVYGDLPDGQVDHVSGGREWSSDVDDLAGGRFLQLRITFVNNVQSLESPELSSLGLAAVQD